MTETVRSDRSLFFTCFLGLYRTLSTRKRRILHLVADSWEPEGGKPIASFDSFSLVFLLFVGLVVFWFRYFDTEGSASFFSFPSLHFRSYPLSSLSRVVSHTEEANEFPPLDVVHPPFPFRVPLPSPHIPTRVWSVLDELLRPFSRVFFRSFRTAHLVWVRRGPCPSPRRV